MQGNLLLLEIFGPGKAAYDSHKVYRKKHPRPDRLRPIRQECFNGFVSHTHEPVVLDLKLELICDERDKLTVGGLALGVGDGVAES